MRGDRLLREYEAVERALHGWGVRSTVVVFGSAQAREDGTPSHARWYREARAFARIVSERGGALAPVGGVRDNVIATGGGPGVMEAANRGAGDAGAPSIGFNISLPVAQPANPYSTPELTFHFHYFAVRKMHLALRASALAAFPGGFGTLDELFEILTLKQTGKTPPIPILLFDEEFWRSTIDFGRLLRLGLVSEEDLRLFEFASDPELAWEVLVRQGV